MSTQPDVLIAGAGPSGLALALLLCRNGLSVRIIDKRSDFKVGQRGAGIHARTLELYKLLGIVSEVEKRSMKLPLRKIYVRGQDEPTSQEPLMEQLPLEPHFFRINGEILRQEEHQNLLREILQNEYGCVVEPSTELESFTQDSEGVSVNIVKEGKQETARVNWLVGADGSRSVVRKQLGLTFLGESHADITMLIGDTEIEEYGDVDEFNWSIWGHIKTKSAFICPYVMNGRKMAFFMLGGVEMNLEEVSKSRENIVNEFREVTDKNVLFGPLYTHAIWRANVRMANKFQEGRVFIVGDAAHVHSPTGGQGMNSSVQDSFNLAWKLALVHKGLSSHSLVESYTTERVPLIAAMLELTTEYMRRDFWGNPSFGQWRRGFETRQLGITYRGTSPILVDERYPHSEEPVDLYRSGLDGTVHAGDRAPEAPGLEPSGSGDGEITSIYEFFDVTSHTVLLFGKSISDVQGFLDLVTKYPRGSVKALLLLPQSSGSQSFASSLLHQTLVDAEGYAYTNYRVQPGDTFAVVVRPDGYIGALAKGASGLNDYFTKVFM